MKKIIIFQFILLFSLGKLVANQELPVAAKKTVEEAFITAGKKANVAFSKVADYMPMAKSQPTFLKRLEDCIYLFEKNAENIWASSIEVISKAYLETSEFVSQVSKDPSILQERAHIFYDQGLLFVDKHPTFSKIAGVIGVLTVASYIRKKIIRRTAIK